MDASPPARGSVPSLLGLACVALVLLPFFVDSALLVRLVRVVVAGILIAAVWLQSRGRVLPGLVLVIAVLDAAAQWLPLPTGPAPVVARMSLSIAFLFTTAGYLAWELWKQERVAAATLLAAIGVYFLLALAWSVAFSLLEFLEPGSFRGLCEPRPGEIECSAAIGLYPRLDYFSFVTLTTLGYGDVVPLRRAAEGMATMASVSGQLFLAVLIARLLGLYMTQARRGGPA